MPLPARSNPNHRTYERDLLVPYETKITINAVPGHKTVDGRDFTGKTKIHARLARATQTLELCADGNLDITEVQCRGRDARVVGIEKQPDRHTVLLRFATPLEPGDLTLVLRFAGDTVDTMEGMYKDVSATHQRPSYATQFEAKGFRRAVPGLDHPGIHGADGRKPIWTLKVRTAPEFTVLGNTAMRQRGGVVSAAEARRKAGFDTALVKHTFSRTQPVPSYLLAWGIGQYRHTDPIDVGGTPVRAVIDADNLSQQQLETQSAWALQVSREVLPWYQAFFGHPYPFDKLDHLVLNNFATGAMENPGLITYRSTAFMLDPAAATVAARERVAEVVAHEIAHQWFGNLVTMAWWDDLWLNEAFATAMSHFFLAAVHPELQPWEREASAILDTLDVDDRLSTPAIYNPVETNDQADEQFSAVTYEKGCAVLRMIAAYVGEDAFRAGLQRHIAAHAFGNATGDDLWDAFDAELAARRGGADSVGAAASGPTLREVVGGWIRQPGFPLVSVETRASEATGETLLRVSQRRFLPGTPPESAGQAAEQLWAVPMVIRYETATGVHEERFLLSQREATLRLPGAVKWVQPNADVMGYYRVQQDAQGLDRLLSAGLAAMSVSDKLALVSAQSALVRAGRQDVASLMAVLEPLAGDADPLVLGAVIGETSYLQRLVHGNEAAEADLAAYVRTILGPRLEGIGLQARPTDDDVTCELRAKLFGVLGHIGHDPDVLARARELAALEKADPMAQEPDSYLASAVLSLAARDASADGVTELLREAQRRFAAGLAPQVAQRPIMAALSVRGEEGLARLLEATLDDASGLPKNLARWLLQSLVGRKSCQQQTWAFIRAHWSRIITRDSGLGLSRLVAAFAELPEDQSEAVRALVGDDVAYTKSLQQALEGIALGAVEARRGIDRQLAAWLRARAG